MKKFLLLFVGLALLACSKDDDNLNPGGPNPGGQNLDTQDFMWKAMNLWYFWQGDVANLADDRFSTDQEYTEFLASESDPALFFNNRLRFSEDRFSFFSEDYRDLTQSLAGTTLSTGLEFGLTYDDVNGNGQLDATDPVYGIVRYVLPNGSAASADIARGDIFIGVDGTNLNGGNFSDLLFGENTSLTLNMADFAGGELNPSGKEVPLTKAVLTENPVFITKTFNLNGTIVGYLMYNGFTNEFDADLNNAFGELVGAGATELVLDLRYNSGGSVNSSRLLSSMIYGTFTNQLYLRQRWNDKIQEAFTRDDPNALDDFFASTIGGGTAVNTLNLSRVYILTSRSTASASELVINGLDPYIDVILIGRTTTGKNEFSLTMVDDPDRSGAPFIYTQSREANINPDNEWAIQPLVGRNENSVGFSDYTAGFAPDIEQGETLGNYGILGDENEPLLALALQEISGMSGRTSTARQANAREVVPFTHSGMFTPTRDNMYLDKNITLPSLEVGTITIGDQ
ncbi:C-terminal processing protease CtpA/Prc, contains a PDZ domain [Robiginitalea myxolifaciens]|uniref:C-terminal processing protease CtpA/Prc, contains a PDZ domain n=1 Tax=Robiginitalea myxolifaciens TaxID=400055 RepID=A0A1I6FMP2_9FLAO|nr:S41 family peptidase [Robiginitalea myxolifaciens]SFR31206.1 C-terminal processing protease CtpA/Prc, contains a PDZ domain [Robiginitalea myxolifaciens]